MKKDANDAGQTVPLDSLVGVCYSDERPKRECPRCDGTGMVLGYDFTEEEDRPFLFEPDLNYGCPVCSGEGYVLDTNVSDESR